MSIFLFSPIPLFFSLPKKGVQFHLFKAEKNNWMEFYEVFNFFWFFVLFFQEGQILSLTNLDIVTLA